MCKFILEFNNNIYIKDIHIKDVIIKENNIKQNHINKNHIKQNHINKNNINKHANNKYNVKDLFIDTIDKNNRDEFSKTINNNNNNYYFIKDNKLINPDNSILDILNNRILNNRILNDDTINDIHIINIKCYSKQIGGSAFGDEILSFLNPIIEPFVAIGDVFKFIYEAFKWSALFLYWCWFFAVWLFSDLLNPKNISADFFNTIQLIIIAIFSSIFTVLLELFKISTNTIGVWVQGFWGWDQASFSQSDRDSNYFKFKNKHNHKKCYLTNSNTIPFSIILGTVLCPPMGVFMDMGLTGWFNILICILLTLCFYIPGLIYALLIIYS